MKTLLAVLTILAAAQASDILLYESRPYTQEIYDGPYSDLPLSIKISSEEIGGGERYEEFFAGQY